MSQTLDRTLTKLAALVRADRFEELETDTLEIKPVPADTAAWTEIHKSACAFLNTRGGILILGVKEEGTGQNRRYVHTDWQHHAEPKLTELPRQFTERNGVAANLSDAFQPPMIRDFLDGKVGIVLIDELPADRKFVFYRNVAYKRVLTGDHKIPDHEIERQEEYKEEALHARELQPVPGMTLGDLDLDKLNQLIFQLNKPKPIETMKSSLEDAVSFLQRRTFVKDGKVTTLGALVCAQYPGEHLGFRAQVHGYVDAPQKIAQDKQDYVDNILQLMESGIGYLLRNIKVGIGAEHGGTSLPEYPEELLRETVNNALAHRDYSVNKQVILAVKPGEHISVQNPGSFRRHLLVEAPDAKIPIRRIIPEAKPRNPKLADVLRVFRKWEGRGIGMATLVSMCLRNQMGLPYYRFGTEEVTLFLSAGRLLDDRMEHLFQAYGHYIREKTQGRELTEPQKLVLSYIIKSEWENERIGYTILLTPDNNHFEEIRTLEQFGLIERHPFSESMYPVYVADRTLMRSDYIPELRTVFGMGFDALDPLYKDVLNVVYRHNHFSDSDVVSAKQVSFNLWYAKGGAQQGIKEFDTFYRKVRRTFNKLAEGGFVNKVTGTRGYVLNKEPAQRHLGAG